MQRLTALRPATALLVSGLLTAACQSSPPGLGASATDSTQGDSPRQAARWSLSPGPPGTPLPPPDPRAADDWPLEFKRFIDAALELFKPGNPEPTQEEFETKLGIKLVPFDWKKTNATWRKAYLVEAPWIYQPKPTDPAWAGKKNALIELNVREKGVRAYLLEFRMGQHLPSCINPYALAIYTGANFTNRDHNPHQAPLPVWPRAYEWGMFKRGYYGRYTSNMGFSIGVNVTNHAGPAQHDATCVATFNISARFKEN